MKYIVDIKGEIEGDYEIIGKYEERPMGERKRGKWIPHEEIKGFPDWICSECGGSGRGDYYFCPWCKTDMRGNQDENN